MELGDESSTSNFEESKEETLIPFDSNRGEVNGDHSELNLPVGDDKNVEETNESPKVNKDGIGDMQKCELFPKSIASSSDLNLRVNSAPSKGRGLKKWRRIRRDFNKDASGGADSSVILKRRLSLNEPPKARDGDNKVKSVVVGEPETPTPSVGSMRSVGSLRSVEAVEAAALDMEIAQLAASSGFSFGLDSDNSEDRSSKSSTAASVHKPRHEIGFGRERTRIKNVGGRGGGHSLQQRMQSGRGGGVEASKKIRGNHIRLEKENSQSSVESDLRSSNVGLMWLERGVNGDHVEKSLNFDLEHGDEAQTCKDAGLGYYKENGVVEDISQGVLDPDLLEEEKKVKRENFQPHSCSDPFVESIVMLQAAQEALETEIKKIGEIGKLTESSDLDDQSEETEVNSSPTLEADMVELNQKIEHLQDKLDAASATVKADELKVLELESIIKKTQLPKGASTTNTPMPEEMHDIEFEIEDLIKKKIQAEVEYLIINRTTRSWKIMAEDQIALLEEQKSLAGDQAQVMLKLRDAEDNAVRLMEKAGELDAHCRKLLHTENVLKLKNKVCKVSSCCFIQLLLLCVAFGLFMIRLVPPSEEIVPT